MRENVKKTHSESLSSFETATLEIFLNKISEKSAKNERKKSEKTIGNDRFLIEKIRFLKIRFQGEIFFILKNEILDFDFFLLRPFFFFCSIFFFFFLKKKKCPASKTALSPPPVPLYTCAYLPSIIIYIVFFKKNTH
jgi:hypothetical protein